jgi:cyclic pyranopterin phosphate synthase
MFLGRKSIHTIMMSSKAALSGVKGSEGLSLSVPALFFQSLRCHSTTSSEGQQLTHTDESGKARMVNVSEKNMNQQRTAVASARVILGSTVFNMVKRQSGHMGKGDVLTVAQLAGIMGAKYTSQLIPLCHPLLLSHVNVDVVLNEDQEAVDVRASVSTVGPTGVEMEALTAASVAGLTVYDMCKAASKSIRITDIVLEEKTGGKSGVYRRGV